MSHMQSETQKATEPKTAPELPTLFAESAGEIVQNPDTGKWHLEIDLKNPELTKAFARAPVARRKPEPQRARWAKGGEEVVTIVNGSRETKRTAKYGDLIVEGPLGEKMVVDSGTIAMRYKLPESTSPDNTTEEFDVIPCGIIRVIDGPGVNIVTETHWGIEWGNGQYLLAAVVDPEDPLGRPSDTKRYLIHRDAYERTYELAPDLERRYKIEHWKEFWRGLPQREYLRRFRGLADRARAALGKLARKP